VRINESNEPMSIMLLDKVNKHEEVIKYMIKMQIEEIERKRPEYFVGIGMGREDFMNHIQEQRREVIQITKDQAPLLN
jgi:hypothetical protein